MSSPPEVDLFRVIVRSRHIQHIEQALEDAGALSVYLASSDEMPLADPRQSDFRFGDQIEALFDYPPDRAPWQALDPQADIHIERVEKIDWVSQSQQNLPRINAPPYCAFGAHARPAHHSYRTAIELEAGAAFGTGHHETTQLCLKAIGALVKRGRIPAQQSCLDMGCGSGILAIALAKSTPTYVIASDIDAEAVTVTRHNAARNGVSQHIHAVEAAGFQHPVIRQHAPYGLIVANILAHPLCDLATGFAEHTRAGSMVVLSGLLQTQAQRVKARFRSAGFVVSSSDFQGDWACLTLTR